MTKSGKPSGIRRFLPFIILVPVAGLFLDSVFVNGKSDVDTAWNIMDKPHAADEAIRLCARAVHFGGLSGEELAGAHECLATAAMRQENFGAALRELETVNSLRPNYPGGLRLWGEVCREMNDNACAAEKFSAAIAASPDKESRGLALTYALRGHTLIDEGKVKDGVADLAHALALAPQNLEILYHYSFALEASGQKREALDLLERIWAEQNHDLFSTFMMSREGRAWLLHIIELRMELGFDPAEPSPPLDPSVPDHRFDAPVAPSFSPLDENPRPEMFE